MPDEKQLHRMPDQGRPEGKKRVRFMEFAFQFRQLSIFSAILAVSP
jgi:hypothetical protein